MSWVVVVLLVVACSSKAPEPSQEPGPPAVAPAPVVAPQPRPPPPFEVPPPAERVVSIGRSHRHACVVRASGAVDCWGEHRGACKECALPRPSDPQVRRAAGVDDAVSISADARCVIRKGGDVACLAADTLAFEPLAKIRRVRAIAPGARCFIVDDGAVHCLDGDDKVRVIPNLRDAVSITAADFHHCVVRRTGQVACGTVWDDAWQPLRGIDRVEQLAIGGRTDTYGCAIAAGAFRCFMIDNDPPTAKPVDSMKPDPAAFAGATQLSLAFEEYAPIVEAVVGGKVVRYQREGEIEVVPVLADATLHIHGCAVRAQGSVACWGTNAGGVLGRPSTLFTEQVPPAPVVGLGGVVDLALGTTDSYALTRDGRVFHWGGRARGEHHTRPVELPLGLGPRMLVQIVASWEGQVCMRSAAGEVWCQISEGDRMSAMRIEQLDTEAVQTMAIDGWRLLVVARADGRREAHALQLFGGPLAAIDLRPTDGGVLAAKCVDKHRCPEQLGLAGATATVIGEEFGCVLQRGQVVCWGFDHVDMRETLFHKPAAIAGIRDATDLAGSREYACAVHSGGRIGCWHFADGKTGPTAVVDVGVTTAVDVELGRGHATQLRDSQTMLHGPEAGAEYGCAILADATVTCWGTNLFGELGDDSFEASRSPIGVPL